MEAEFQNIIEDKKTRIGLFKCRLAGASTAQASYTLVILMAMFFIFRVAQR